VQNEQDIDCYRKPIFLILGFLMSLNNSAFSQVSINNDGSSPDNKAMLDVKSTSKGFLIPRMTQSEISSILNPTDGLTVLCTTNNKIYVFNITENIWKAMQYGSGTISPVPTDGLILYFPFNGNANDESGNGNNGTVYGATLTADRFGSASSAYDFNGVNAYINIPSHRYIKCCEWVYISHAG